MQFISECQHADEGGTGGLANFSTLALKLVAVATSVTLSSRKMKLSHTSTNSENLAC